MQNLADDTLVYTQSFAVDTGLLDCADRCAPHWAVRCERQRRNQREVDVCNAPAAQSGHSRSNINTNSNGISSSSTGAAAIWGMN